MSQFIREAEEKSLQGFKKEPKDSYSKSDIADNDESVPTKHDEVVRNDKKALPQR